MDPNPKFGKWLRVWMLFLGLCTTKLKDLKDPEGATAIYLEPSVV